MVSMIQLQTALKRCPTIQNDKEPPDEHCRGFWRSDGVPCSLGFAHNNKHRGHTSVGAAYKKRRSTTLEVKHCNAISHAGRVLREGMRINGIHGVS